MALVVLLGAIATLIGGCSPVQILNAIVSEDAYTATRDLAYGPDPRQKLDLYQPRALPPPSGGFPVVVFFYGGSWHRGERRDYKFVAESLAAEGIVVALADYRLYPQVRYPEFLEDCARAVAAVRRDAARYGADPGKLFVMGHSAGAYNAAMLALDSRWLAAHGLSPSVLAGWIGLAGPYDFLPTDNQEVRPVFGHPSYPSGSQPVDHVSKAAPRTFLGAASHDSVVDPDRNTRRMAERLQAVGVPVTVKVYDRVSHLSLAGAFARSLRSLAPVLEDVSRFVHEDVK